MLLAALMWVGVAQAAANPKAAPVADAPLLAQAAPSNDDDDDEPVKPATPPPSSTKPTDAKPADATAKPADAKPTSPTKPAASSTAPAATDAKADEPKKFELVSGAPLYNPNVAVHIVEKKTYSDTGRFEVVLFPATMQINGKFTQHFGSQASIVYHLQENFALQITGGYNWYNSESSFNGELVEKARTEAQAATSLLLTGGVTGGVEVTPFYGKFSLFEGTLAHFSVVLNGGAGVGWTRHQLKPESVRQDGSISGATYGDTGARFMGGLGLGFRVRFGDHFALRLEVRDTVYTARTDRVNGCNVDDLRAMDAKVRAGQDVLTASVTQQCSSDGLNPDNPKFAGTDDNGNKRSNDVPLALNLVRVPSSDVLNNIGLYLGAAFIF